MRNFHMTADIDGRELNFTGGPTKKDGGMTVVIRQNDRGNSVVAFTVSCLTEGDKLITQVIDNCGEVIEEFVTTR